MRLTGLGGSHARQRDDYQKDKYNILFYIVLPVCADKGSRLLAGIFYGKAVYDHPMKYEQVSYSYGQEDQDSDQGKRRV